MQKQIKLKSTITCPICGFSKEEKMPQDSCQFFYECRNCKSILKPRLVIVVFFVRTAVSHAQRFMQVKIIVKSLNENYLFSC